MKMSNLKRGLSERDKVIVDRLDKLQKDQKNAMNVQRTRHKKSNITATRYPLLGMCYLTHLTSVAKGQLVAHFPSKST